MTPEGRIKQKIKKVLDIYKEDGIYYFMPVPGGYGKSTLDYLGFFYGFGFAVEAKAPGEKPTPRQEGTIADIGRSGAPVFVIDGEETLAPFARWLAGIHNQFH